MKLLVVDDVGLIRKQFQHLLGRTDHEVLIAEDGHRALALLRSNPSIDAVITDLLMPGMNGVELFVASQQIERCTDDGQDGGPDFVLVTGVRPTSRDAREAELLHRASKLGFLKIIPKPIQSPEILAAVEAIAMHREDSGGGDDRDFEALAAILAEMSEKFGTDRVRDAVERSLATAG